MNVTPHRVRRYVGTLGFLIVNLIAIAVLHAASAPLVTVTASLEVIALAVLILAAQKRARHRATVRAEVGFHVNVVTEAELTELLRLISRLAARRGIDLSNDRELREMKRSTDVARIERELLDEIRR